MLELMLVRYYGPPLVQRVYQAYVIHILVHDIYWYKVHLLKNA
jgi:hypothetical protein